MINQEIIYPGTIPDNEVITRILQVEKELYSVIIRRYNQRLYRIGMSILKDDAEVEDAMQVAYINAFEHLRGFEFKSGFSTWLTRILINESLLRLKKRKRSMAMNDNKIDSRVNSLEKDHNTPLSKIINQELKLALEEAIHQLPEKYRTVFVMREIEDMSTSETQACLDLSEVNVKVRLNRAKAMLRESLSNFYKKEEILHFYLTRCNSMVERVMQELRKV